MEQILNILGFTDPVGVFWNVLAYVGMVMIIVAVISAKLRNRLFFLGPLLLLFYAWLFLNDPIFIGLEIIVTASGLLNLLNIKKRASFVIVILLTGIVYFVLLVLGKISEFWSLIGSFGLLGIAFGFTQLPKKRGFTLMMLGGFLIIAYAFVLQIWVFVLLNLIFSIVNIFELRKKNKR